MHTGQMYYADNIGMLVICTLRLLNEFNKDPLKYFRFMMGIEDQTHYGDKIIKQIAYRYFTIDRPYHPNQLDKVGEVREI